MPIPIKLILGTAQFGSSSRPYGARVHRLEDAQELVDLFVSYGYDKIDSSRVYGGGTSEEIDTHRPLLQVISQLNLKGCTVDTKVLPNGPGGLTAENVKESLATSVRSLGHVKIQTFYLHGPDRSTPIEETLRAVNDLCKEGLFDEFGICNFSSWEVAEVVHIADNHGWIKPTVYQGLYNVIERSVEAELLPCLRHFGIRFYAYSPLAGGALTGRMMTETDIKEYGGRWDPSVSIIAESLHHIFTPMLPALRELKDALDEHSISLPEAAFRWLQHHSKLVPEAGDRIIVGASNVIQLGSNLKDSNGGPLSEKITEILDNAWLRVKPIARYYSW